jgi:hypothetical protein
MRFIDYDITLELFGGDRRTIHGIIIDESVVESSYEPREWEINDAKRIKAMNIFDDECCATETCRQRYRINFRGRMLILTRNHGFVEADIVGTRGKCIIDKYSIDVSVKNPTKRDIVYITTTYPGIQESVLLVAKSCIERAIVENPRKRQILTRLIDYIRNVEHPKPDESDDPVLKIDLGANSL